MKQVSFYPDLFTVKPINKDSLVSGYIRYMLSRTQAMFSYKGLPETIPERMLELYLQGNGNCCIAEYKGKLYAFTGGLGGEPDEYYRPTIYTVSNPALKMSENYRINENCVLILNDAMMFGMLPMFEKYAFLMAENTLSIRVADVNSRIISLITAGNDRAKEAAEAYLKKVEAGELAAVGSDDFLKSIETLPYATAAQSGTITDLIELQQYLKASWYNDLGLNANYNMKRESINSEEAQLNDDALLPLVDNMLSCRREGIEKVNKMFDLNISVRLSSSWEDVQEQAEPGKNETEKEENENEERIETE